MTRVRSDVARTAFLNSRGYRVLRFWNNEVLQQTDAVMPAIYDALCEDRGSAPTPNPSPPLASLAGGGEKAEFAARPLWPSGRANRPQLAARPFNPEAGRELQFGRRGRLLREREAVATYVTRWFRRRARPWIFSSSLR